MKLGELKINSAALERGAWIGDIPQMAKLRLHVRGMGNADYRRVQAKLIAAVPVRERRDGLDVRKMDEIEGVCLGETVLLGWDGLENDDGSPLAYSKEFAQTLIDDPDYVMFRNAVMYAAGRVAEIEDEAVQETMGNF